MPNIKTLYNIATHPDQKQNTWQALMKNRYDAIIIGASAAGLMCAIEAGKRGRRVLVVDYVNKACRRLTNNPLENLSI